MMINRCTFPFLLAMICLNGIAQNRQIEGLRIQLDNAREDTDRILLMAKLSLSYGSFNADSAFAIANRAIELAQQIKFPRGEVRGLVSLGNEYDAKGDLPKALESGFRGLAIAEENHLFLEKSICLSNIGDIYWDLNDYAKAILFFQKEVQINRALEGQPEAAFWRFHAEQSLGAVFMLNNQLDSAFAYLDKLYKETLNDTSWHPSQLMFFGRLEFLRGKTDTGLNYLRESIRLFQMESDHYSLGDACRFISECFREQNRIDSSIYYAKKGLAEAQSIGYKSPIYYNSKTLAELYEPIDVKEALYYRKVFDTVTDIYYGPNKVRNLQNTLSEEEERQRKMEAASIAYRNSLKQYALSGGLLIILLIAFILYRNNRQRQRANELLQQQKEKIENTLAELKSTQSQLVQQEKLASLGALTAGIAHEIQNPLNFVNNFSDINRELLTEQKEELDRGNIEEAKTILVDVLGNEEKINQHGKRADAIVKGMLLHSRSNTGLKEPTDINALADDYLRLSYHGIRAKDNTFSAKMQTDYDNSIGKISLVQQDIGRVLLNLYNNAFYAVNEKWKSGEPNYEPTVSVSTERINNEVKIAVKDNGNGIPEKVVDKIFHPFFTTKPAGQGTGLGLSLSYDIVKMHGGEIKVFTKPGEGTEFIIHLPAV